MSTYSNYCSKAGKMVIQKSFYILRGLIHLIYAIYFISNTHGKEYGIGKLQKLILCFRIYKNNNKLKSLSTAEQHLVLIDNIFKIPKSIKGDVVECGCFNGASTANLSIACALTNRRLFVCDSFEGIPQPLEEEKITIRSDAAYYLWKKGEFASEGGLDGVRKTIEKFGKIEPCEFVKGYFDSTLKNLKTDSIILIFEDADIPSSVKTCLTELWPKLQEGCRFYSHEPWSIEVVSLFYDNLFWKRTLNESPPGFYGAAVGGIIADLIYFKIGYAVKRNVKQVIDKGKRVLIEGSIA